MYQTSRAQNGTLMNLETWNKCSDPDELRDYIGVIDHHQQQHQDEGEPQAELLADQVAEAFAGDHAHARAHLLHHDQRDGDGDDGPQQRVAVLSASLRIGKDAAGVVIHVGGYESGTEHGQKQKDADSPTFRHARSFLRRVHEFPHRP
jgi:hypothetical protein